jgi:hypothetical protein
MGGISVVWRIARSIEHKEYSCAVGLPGGDLQHWARALDAVGKYTAARGLERCQAALAKHYEPINARMFTYRRKP